MKLRKINSETAIDKDGNGWFRTKTADRHSFWITCEICGKRVQFYWFDWPDLQHKICDNCVELEER